MEGLYGVTCSQGIVVYSFFICSFDMFSGFPCFYLREKVQKRGKDHGFKRRRFTGGGFEFFPSILYSALGKDVNRKDFRTMPPSTEVCLHSSWLWEKKQILSNIFRDN